MYNFIKSGILSMLVLAACQPATQESAESEPQQPLFVDDGGLELSDGFRSTVVADSTYRNARHIIINDNGDIYVKTRGSEGNGVLALRDTDGDGKVDVKAEFSSVGGVFNVSTPDAFSFAVQALHPGSPTYKRAQRALKANQGYWGRLDGKSVDRINELVLELAALKPVPRTSA